MITRTVAVEVSFIGDGRGSGQIAPPVLADKLVFLVHREALDEAGIWNPVRGESSLLGGLQVNLWADSGGYRELARYFLALSELDARGDPGFHEHHAGMRSADGRTRLHIICRKGPQSEWPADRE